MSTGKQVGGYILDVLLGQGGMGEVYRGYDHQGRPVAIKFLMDLSPAMRARFHREARVLEAMKHPNIVAYYGEGVDGDRPYLIMEYLEGETLTARLERGALAVQEAVYITRAMCLGLAHGHANGLIHRDLKPSNIFLTNDGGVKILDFGLARFEREPALTASGIIMGTPSYMAPEQLVDSESIGPRGDIWAVGAMFYQMRTGSVPFETNLKDLQSIQRAINSRQTSPDRKGMMDGEYRIVLKALAPRLEDRFLSAREMWEALKRIAPDSSIADTVAMSRPPYPVAFYKALAAPETRRLRPARPSSASKTPFQWFRSTMLVTALFVGWYLHRWVPWKVKQLFVGQVQTMPVASDRSSADASDQVGLDLPSCSYQEHTDESVQRAIDGYAENGGRCRSPECSTHRIRQHIRQYWGCISPERRHRLCWLACESTADDYLPRGELPNECQEVMATDNPCVATTVPSAP